MASSTIHISKIRGLLKDNLSAIVTPTVNDDSSAGYSIGSMWVDTALDNSYICIDSTIGSAVWKIVTDIKNNYSATTSPTTNDDSGDGYSVGSTWVDVTNDNSFICVDSTIGSAVWNIQNKGTIKNNYSGTVAPLVTNDSVDGYSVGSTWIDVVNDNMYTCVDNTAGAAVWNIHQKTIGSGTTLIAVQDSQPSTKSLWVQTNVNGNVDDIMLWVVLEDL